MKVISSTAPEKSMAEVFLNGGLANVLLYENVLERDDGSYEYTVYDIRESWDGTYEELLNDVKNNRDNWIKKGFALIKYKLIESISSAAGKAIISGVELETSKGMEHFSLTAEDQMNIQNLSMQAAAGAEYVLYHSDGNLCRRFSPQEIMLVAQKAVEHATYHQTYFNHLKAWILRLETLEEIEGIDYGAVLPDDLQKSMSVLLG